MYLIPVLVKKSQPLVRDIKEHSIGSRHPNAIAHDSYQRLALMEMFRC